MYRTIDKTKDCPKCNLTQYGWDGVERHLMRGWCKALDHKKLTKEEAWAITYNEGMQPEMEAKEQEWQQEEAYDRQHNLGAYSY